MKPAENWRKWFFTPRDFSSAKDLDARVSWALVWQPSARMARQAAAQDKGKERGRGHPPSSDFLSEWLQFVAELRSCGSQLICAGDDQFTDQVYIGDHLRLFGGVLVQGRMKSPVRRAEGEFLSGILQRVVRPEKFRQINGPEVTLELGDTVVFEELRLVFLGTAGRTNKAGLRALQRVLADFNWRVVDTLFDADQVTHLTGAAVEIGEDAVLVNPQLVDPDIFSRQGLEVVETLEHEPQAAASFWLRMSKAPRLIVPAQCRETADVLCRRGCPVVPCGLGRFIASQGVAGALCAYIHCAN